MCVYRERRLLLLVCVCVCVCVLLCLFRQSGVLHDSIFFITLISLFGGGVGLSLVGSKELCGCVHASPSDRLRLKLTCAAAYTTNCIHRRVGGTSKVKST